MMALEQITRPFIIIASLFSGRRTRTRWCGRNTTLEHTCVPDVERLTSVAGCPLIRIWIGAAGRRREERRGIGLAMEARLTRASACAACAVCSAATPSAVSSRICKRSNSAVPTRNLIGVGRATDRVRLTSPPRGSQHPQHVVLAISDGRIPA